ncbi:MAG TPA: penicillin-binding protein 1A [Steroidobacteraceae bacterium]|nr:penicillin-binding protein 1A [Steroidobacteraceae bacterium]
MKPQDHRAIRWAAATIVGAIGVAFIVVAGATQYLSPQIPDVASLRDVHLQVPLRIYSRDGKLIAQIGEQRRIPLNFEDYPKQVINAFLAAEDDRFFEHSGIDYIGLIRAIAVNVSTGSKREGGGTITMQLARNMFLSPERSYRRKMLEIISAWRIEHEFSKTEILSLYLNKIFLGQRAYGVGAAAEVYFGKSVNELSLPEIALLAGLPRAPSRENPVTNPVAAKQRRAYVLRRMKELRFISVEEQAQSDVSPVESRLHGAGIELDAPYIAEMARQELESKFGERIYTDNFIAYTTVDSRLQGAAQRGVRLALIEYDARHGYRGATKHFTLAKGSSEKDWLEILEPYTTIGGLEPALVTAVTPQTATVYSRNSGALEIYLNNMKWARPYIDVKTLGKAPEKVSDVVSAGDLIYVAQQANGSWRLMQIPATQAAFASVDPDDGAIMALVGGFDYDASSFNRAVQAKRQPGSSFKPFLYSAALDYGFTPASLINDAPLVVDDDGTHEGPWRPQNTNKEFMGPIRIREALYRSRNLVSIRLLSNIGTAYATDYIQRFGFTPNELPQNLSLALGATQVTPLQMARGYAVFANGGMRVEPYLIERVMTGDGQLVFNADPLLACDPCLSANEYTTSDRDKSTIRVDAASSEESSDVTSSNEDASQDTPAVVHPVVNTYGRKFAPRVISKPNVFLMTDMMKDVIRRGTATRALVLGRRDIAGKTGTTNDRRDAWFVGFNGDLVGAAWLGFDQERPLGESEEGGRTALPIWIYFMQEALKGLPEHSFPQPADIVSMRIIPETGKIAPANSRNGVFEYFMREHLPESEPADSNPETAEPSGTGLF